MCVRHHVRAPEARMVDSLIVILIDYRYCSQLPVTPVLICQQHRYFNPQSRRAIPLHLTENLANLALASGYSSEGVPLVVWCSSSYPLRLLPTSRVDDDEGESHWECDAPATSSLRLLPTVRVDDDESATFPSASYPLQGSTTTRENHIGNATLLSLLSLRRLPTVRVDDDE